MRQPAERIVGTKGVIRQLRPSDLPPFTDHLLRLDQESRRDRFNGATENSFLETYAGRCFTDGTTVVGYIENEKVVGAAEIHERPEDEEPTAEIAFSVERPFQNRGIGGRLFERLIVHALALGYLKLRVTTHAQNAAMKTLARHFDATLKFEEGEAVGLIELDPMLEPGLRRSTRVFSRSASGLLETKQRLAASVD